MSPTQTASQNSKIKAGTTGGRGDISWGMILLGVVLLLLALLLFLYVFIYYPRQREFIGDQRIQRIPPPVRSANPQPLPSPTPLPSNPATEKTRQRNSVLRQHASRVVRSAAPTGFPDARAFDATRRFNHAVSYQSQPVPVLQASPAPTPQVSPSPPTATRTPESVNQTDKPNILRRFIRWIARLFKKEPPKPVNSPPTVTLAASSTEIYLPCLEEGEPVPPQQVQLLANATDPDNDRLLYTYSTTGGRITGEGAKVTWDLSGVSPGIFMATVEVDDKTGKTAYASANVVINGPQCPPPPCPTISMDCPDDLVLAGQQISYTVHVDGGVPGVPLTYNWTVSAGTITSGQGTPTITVDTNGLEGGAAITAKVEVGGAGTECARGVSCMFVIARRSQSTGGISGTVLDKNNAAIAGAIVIVRDQNGNEVGRTVTDGEGRYLISNLPLGTYDVEIAVQGFGRQTRRGVQVEIGRASALDVAFGTPDATPSPTVEPSPQASPTPTPTETPSASPTPAKTLVEQDQITARYPDRFLKNTNAEISFELEMVLRELRPPETTTTNANVKVIDVAPSFSGAKPSTFRPVNEADYDTYLIVRLIPTGLTITSEADNSERRYTGKKEEWKWKLRPADGVGTEASFRFQVEVIWKANKPGISPDIVRQTVDWPVAPLTVLIGPPVATIRAAIVSSPLLAAGGIAAIGVGRKRRKELLGAESEEAGIEDKPETAVAEDEVTSSVYAPTEAQIGEVFLVQVFAHLEEEAAGLAEIAKAAQPGVIWRGADKLNEKIKRGTELVFHLSMPGLEVDRPEQSRIWNGTTEQLQFMVTVPRDCQPGNLGGKVTVSRSTVPIGHLSFIIKISSKVPEAAVARPAEPVAAGSLVRYRRAFISYTSRDRWEVLKRVQVLELVGMEYFQDLLTLKPGDKWEKLIYEYIDKSDLFLLFWSKAASESEWVTKEVLYAIKRQAGKDGALPEIKPVILEVPPPKPPEGLSSIHFNDKISYLINSGNALGYFWWLIRNKLLVSVIEDLFRRSD